MRGIIFYLLFIFYKGYIYFASYKGKIKIVFIRESYFKHVIKNGEDFEIKLYNNGDKLSYILHDKSKY